MIIYIAGPITGDPDYKTKFYTAEKEIEAMGFIPLNPAWQPQGLEYKQYIDISMAMLKQADAAVFLPGWRNSPGAKAEYEYCMTHSVPCACSDSIVGWKMQLWAIATTI